MPDRDVGIAVRDGKLHPRIPPATKTELKNILVATFQLEPTRRPKFTGFQKINKPKLIFLINKNRYF